ncbi:MAG: nuclear transport factor 2 family protein [Gammaproteobacteria bacterium HGW-Gammaproteobacteria-14]|nr:MAG: nuclear transport factor 2 family protein [Gammaproteobacteria bacterium HGW-Gammaproteobacteria-14]
MNKDSAQEFATEWIEAWNSHDIDRILSHYADDFEMNSPVIARRVGVASGVLQGKDQIRPYWQQAFEEYPDLEFKLLQVLQGVSWMTIYYLGARGKEVAETFIFNPAGEVIRVYASYA